MKKADQLFRSAFSTLMIAALVSICASFILFHAYDLILTGVVDVLLFIRGPGQWNCVFPMDIVHRTHKAGSQLCGKLISLGLMGANSPQEGRDL